jgi:co-chaperonin GroES (HSP10)
MPAVQKIKPLKIETKSVEKMTENRFRVRSGLHWMKREDNTKELIMEALGAAPMQIQMIKALVLVATYKRPAETEGGIITDGRHEKEDEYQGRVGLVVAMGPLAFKDDDKIKWAKPVPKLGDWVFYDADEGRGTSIMGVHCRVFEDVALDGILEDPNLVF